MTGTPTGTAVRRAAAVPSALVADQATRRAAVLAAGIAVPVALLAGVLSYRALVGATAAPAGTAGPGRTGATAPVPMAAPSLAPARATMCLAFIAKLPVRLRDLPQRKVSAGPEQNAAYGEPPVTVACGAPPASVPPSAYLVGPREVCWYADQSRPGVTVWTTLDRQVPITVTMPDAYQGQGDWIQEFTAPIIAAVPSLPVPPAFCAAPQVNPS